MPVQLSPRVFPIDQPSLLSNNGAAESSFNKNVPTKTRSVQSQDLPHSGILDLTLYAPNRVLILLWWYMLLYQLCNAAMLGRLSYMYLMASERNSILWYIRYNFLFARAARFLDQVSLYVSTAYLLFALGFFYGAGSMLWASLTHRRLCYGMKISTAAQGWPSRSRNSCEPVSKLVRKGIDIWQSFSISGKRFASGLIVREGVEAALQTIQASSSAKQISNPFVNHSYAVLIFINCCSSYLYGFLFRADQVHRRLACVLTDLTLDFVWGTIMPVIVFAPYVRLYMNRNDVNTSAASESVENEVQQMLVLSPQAFILSIFPFVSALGNLRGIKRLLEQAKTTARPHGDNYEGVNPTSQTEGEQTSFRGHLMQNKTVHHVVRQILVVNPFGSRIAGNVWNRHLGNLNRLE